MEVRSVDYTPDALVRLHVLADSDDAEAQRLKRAVAYCVRARAARVCRDCKSAEEAFEKLRGARNSICRTAARAARRYRRRRSDMESASTENRAVARRYGVTVETGTFPFPACQYGDRKAPEGLYRAVRVTLGSGRGHNWWCVLYPELCAVDALVAAALAQDAPVAFYSSIGRALTGFFSWLGL